MNFRRDEIRSLSVTSDQHVRSAVRAVHCDVRSVADDVARCAGGREPKLWRREEASANPFRAPVVTKLYAKNLGTAAANVRITAVRRVANPEMLLVPIMAVGMAAMFFAYLLQRAAMPKLAAVALSTTKSDIAQPLYAILMAVGHFRAAWCSCSFRTTRSATTSSSSRIRG